MSDFEFEPVYVHRYVLRSGTALNAASMRREFEGALLRIGNGFGCVHPWPEFGDAPLEQQLKLLAEGQLTPVTTMAVRMAREDGAAREAGVSLFDNLPVPPSHYSWSFGLPQELQLRRVIENGWLAVKAKGFANWGETLRFLEASAKAAPNLRWRIDFNGCLDRHGFGKFLECMPLRVYRQLDFVEDPLPYDAEAWEHYRRAWGVSLALDKGWRDGTTGFDRVVVKPARRDWRVVAQTHPAVPLVLTSAMDHALGQSYAAWQAALAWQELGERLDLCGLVTQHLFDADPFFERLAVSEGVLLVDRAGTGLGFDDILERLPWTRLS